MPVLGRSIADVSGDLLQHAGNLQKDEQNGEGSDSSGTATVGIGDEDDKDLSREALLKKRCRLLWFYQDSGRKFRINVHGHPPCSTGKDMRSALCGNVKHNEDKLRGMRDMSCTFIYIYVQRGMADRECVSGI